MTKLELVEQIQEAFFGVTLGLGFSLRQATIMDAYGCDRDGRELSHKEFEDVRQLEITHDWTLVPIDELEDNCYLAYLDPHGFRYYIPAYLVFIVKQFPQAGCTPMVFFYLNSDANDECFTLLNTKQRKAIASFVFQLPFLWDLNKFEEKQLERCFKNHWSAYA